MGCGGLRCSALPAGLTWGMCFQMGRSLRDCGIASIVLRWDSRRSKSSLEKQEKPQPATTRLGRPVSGALCGWLAFDDFAGLDAAGADAHALAATVYLGFDGLQVHVPATTGGVVGVRDVIAKLRAFAAKITFCAMTKCSNLESQKIPGALA